MVSYDNIDPFKVLGVARDASPMEIRRQYRKTALRVHPDHNDDPDALGQFQVVLDAYDIVNDPAKLERWDMAQRRRNADRLHKQRAPKPQNGQGQEEKTEESQRHTKEFAGEVKEEADRIRRDRQYREQGGTKAHTRTAQYDTTPHAAANPAGTPNSPFQPYYGPYRRDHYMDSANQFYQRPQPSTYTPADEQQSRARRILEYSQRYPHMFYAPTNMSPSPSYQYDAGWGYGSQTHTEYPWQYPSTSSYHSNPYGQERVAQAQANARPQASQYRSSTGRRPSSGHGPPFGNVPYGTHRSGMPPRNVPTPTHHVYGPSPCEDAGYQNHYGSPASCPSCRSIHKKPPSSAPWSSENRRYSNLGESLGWEHCPSRNRLKLGEGSILIMSLCRAATTTSLYINGFKAEDF